MQHYTILISDLNAAPPRHDYFTFIYEFSIFPIHLQFDALRATSALSEAVIKSGLIACATFILFLLRFDLYNSPSPTVPTPMRRLIPPEVIQRTTDEWMLSSAHDRNQT